MEESDIWQLDHENTAGFISQKFENCWRAETTRSARNGEGRNVGVVTVLWNTFGRYFLMGLLLTILPDLLDIAAPTILG